MVHGRTEILEMGFGNSEWGGSTFGGDVGSGNPRFTFRNMVAAKRKRNLGAFGLLNGDTSWIEDNSPAPPALVGIAGAIDGSNVFFLLPALPLNEPLIFVNGIRQFLNSSYTRDGAAITFQPGWIPQPGDQLSAVSH